MFFATGDDGESKPSTSTQTQQPCRHFEFNEILVATKNFDKSLVIGTGGFGKVYKGNIIYGSSVVVAAIKRLDSMSDQGAAEFWTEVEMLSMLRHCNLVSLIGYCKHEDEMILVYEYVPNGTLEDHLHKLCTPLTWHRRLAICIGACRGLHYLHTGTGITTGIIHRDVKSSNILLHEKWAAKISDFGLSKIGPTNQPSTYVNTHIKGTFGYLDPNYFATGKLTRKSDVYAFGVVLLEVLCRKHAVDKSIEDWGLVTWAQDYIKEGNLKRIIDPGIRGEISPKCLKVFVGIADKCLQTSPRQRPTMNEVMSSLECALTLQEKFNKSTGSRTIFGRMMGMLAFPSNGENSGQGDPESSGNSKGNNTLPEIKEVHVDSQTRSTSVNVYKLDDLEKATREYRLDLLLGEGGFGRVHVDSESRSPSVKVFRSDDLKSATRTFSLDLLLGEGGLGKVFLGWVNPNTLAPSGQDVGIAVAIKRLDRKCFQGHVEWLTEVNFLEQMDHPNIIRLLGYCRDENEHVLVYEYMPRKSLDRFLFRDSAISLSWETRLWIMIGVARGLAYLHLKRVIHRDLKPSDILLDEEFNAKLGNFGLVIYGPEISETNVYTRVMGTPGYTDPEYLTTSRLTTKSDIYGLGMVLLESITGVRAIDFNGFEGLERLVEWERLIQSNGRNMKEIIDIRLEDNYPLQSASECIALAFRCVARNPEDRPSSLDVFESLKQIYIYSSPE